MHLPSLFVLIVYVAAYIFLLFAAICLACGLYYLVELTEEYTTLTKKTIRLIIYINLALHVLLFFYERFSFMPCLVGFLAHVLYFNLLRPFPFIRPLSLPSLAALAAFTLDNFVWFRFFQSDHEIFYRYAVAPVPATAAFFLLLVWLIPAAFFCSLTVNDAVLPAFNPQQAHANASNLNGSTSASHPKKRRNIVIVTLVSAANMVRNFLGTGNSSRRNEIFN